MIRTVLVAGVLGLGLTAVLAQSDPIAERRNTMKAVGGATRDGAAMAKGEVAFDASKAQAVFKVYSDAAKKMPGLFPDSSKTGGETTASPKIWEDQAGFKAAFVKFEADASAGGVGYRSRRLPYGLRQCDEELWRLPRDLSRQEIRAALLFRR